jgi:hypothetical protein
MRTWLAESATSMFESIPLQEFAHDHEPAVKQFGEACPPLR